MQSSSSTPSESNMETITPASGTSDATNKKSWVWKYFKSAEIQGNTYNLFQVSKILGGTKLCGEKLAVEKCGSMSAMCMKLGGSNGCAKYYHCAEIIKR